LRSSVAQAFEGGDAGEPQSGHIVRIEIGRNGRGRESLHGDVLGVTARSRSRRSRRPRREAGEILTDIGRSNEVGHSTILRIPAIRPE
jgi:hypothetical protein